MNARLLFFIIVLFSFGCKDRAVVVTENSQEAILALLEVPTNIIDKSQLVYDNKISIWSFNGVPFSGYAVTYLPDSLLVEKFGILNGKKQNKATSWYSNGQLKLSANYYQGQLHGEKKSWTADDPPILIAHLNYHLGKAHGTQKKWYPTGELYKILQLNQGKEEGIQQAFRKNGDLYANYEARNGRTFGLKKAALCFGLEEEKVQTK